MEEKKMQNKKVLFLFLIILILLVGGFFVWENFGGKEEQKVAVEKSPIDVIDNGDGTKTVKNVEDNLQVIVDNSWVFKSGNSDYINLLKKGEDQPLEDTGLADGIDLTVKVLANGDNLDVNNWLVNNSILTKEEIDSIKLVEVFGTKLYIFEDSYDSSDFLPEGVENTVFNFMFVEDNKIVDYSCNIITDESKKNEYEEVCLELVKQNIK